jgi:hypothetical protein
MALYFRKAVAEHLRQLYTRSEFKVALGLTEKSNNLSSVQDRLRKLKQLYQDGIITEEEYNQKRQAVLNEI